jgi:uncharacterized membrane protein
MGMPTGPLHGFRHGASWQFPIDYPGATGTTPHGVNDAGDIVGIYYALGQHAFLLRGEVFIAINPPESTASTAYGINLSGQIVGSYITGPPWSGHGYLFSDGMFTAIDFPGGQGTSAAAINNAGCVAGSYARDTAQHGFLYCDSVFTSIDVPGALQTWAFGINDSGQIVGRYTDLDGIDHGFLATPVPEPRYYGIATMALAGMLFVVRRCDGRGRGSQKRSQSRRTEMKAAVQTKVG